MQCACMQELWHVTRVLTAAAAALALPLALACYLIPLFLPHVLTADAAVIAAMRPLAPTAGAAILLCTLDVACEGVLVAQRRLRFLITSMTVVLGAVAAYFAAGGGASVTATWAGLLIFFGMRSALSAVGVARSMLRGLQGTGSGMHTAAGCV